MLPSTQGEGDCDEREVMRREGLTNLPGRPSQLAWLALAFVATHW